MDALRKRRLPLNAWDNVPHTSARLLNVACPSWNQVDMAMMNGLACSFAHVDAHIDPGDGGILSLCSTFCFI
jgi:hypothetical protein